MKKLLFLMTLALFINCNKTSFYSKTILAKNKKIKGQMAPLDMVLIPGNSEIPSFYMSVSEEPNINYLIYLKWLKHIYDESFPEVVLAALPKKKKTSDLFHYNDPYIHAYMTHPAFSYYPVTGLSWVQIQDYMQWKTDRLNEAILIDLGILGVNLEQKDEDNFNTEAYLNGQYEGRVNKPLIHEITERERRVSFDDGILFTGFRLATEAEWEYASQAKFQKKIDRKGCLNPLSSNAINHPYGQNYYTLRWGRTFENSISINYGPDLNDVINVSDHRNNGFAYTPDEDDYKGIPQRLTSIGDYDPNEYGLINMETNVREWVVDYYEEEFDASVTDARTIFEKSGFNTPIHLDQEGNHIVKDSIGRMIYFRIHGINSDGSPMEVSRYGAGHIEARRNKWTLEIDLTKERDLLYHVKNETPTYARIKKDAASSIVSLEDLLKKCELSPESNIICSNTQYIFSRIKSQQQIIAELNVPTIETRIAKIEQQLTSLSEKIMATIPGKDRLVKGGTWKNPGKQRMPLGETEGHVDVGFRCVLPYTGMPVKEGYRVKWKR